MLCLFLGQGRRASVVPLTDPGQGKSCWDVKGKKAKITFNEHFSCTSLLGELLLNTL